MASFGHIFNFAGYRTPKTIWKHAGGVVEGDGDSKINYGKGVTKRAYEGSSQEGGITAIIVTGMVKIHQENKITLRKCNFPKNLSDIPECVLELHSDARV